MFYTEIDVRQPQCEYDGCFRTARYGPREGHISFCQDHKRAGMYTSRNGKWLVATNDGNAFRSAGRRGEYVGMYDGMPPTRHASGRALGVAGVRRARRKVQHERNGGTARRGRTEAPSSEEPTHNSGEAPERRVQGPTPTPEKPCVASGCSNPEDHGDKRGPSDPVLCGDPKAPDMVQISNRTCIYPGCDARACYGIQDARAVYCAEHKKGPMMRLLLVTQEGNISGSPLGSKAEDVSTEASAPAIKASHPFDEGQSASCASASVDEQGQPEALRGGSAKGGEMLMRGNPFSGTPMIPCSFTSTDAIGAAHAPEVRAMGGAPSAEMRLLQQAREVARAAARASGSSRRARAPSLKALRAAGLLDEEGTQVQTKAMNDEEVRKSKERREQWRANVAVGLRVGHVLEALTPNGLPDSSRDGTAAASPEGRETWRRLTAEETLSHGRGIALLQGIIHQDRGLGDTGPSVRTLSGVGCTPDRGFVLDRVSDGVKVIPAKRNQSDVCRGAESIAGSGAVAFEIIGVPNGGGVNCAEELPQEEEGAVGGANGNGIGDKGELSGHAKVWRSRENCRKKPRFDADGVACCCRKHESLRLH